MFIYVKVYYCVFLYVCVWENSICLKLVSIHLYIGKYVNTYFSLFMCVKIIFVHRSRLRNRLTFMCENVLPYKNILMYIKMCLYVWIYHFICERVLFMYEMVCWVIFEFMGLNWSNMTQSSTNTIYNWAD